jgi:hypothetical protein
VRYFIQFAAGLGELVADALAGQLTGLRIMYADDSAMIVEVSDPPHRVAALPYVKNAFQIVTSVARNGLDGSVARLGRGLQGVTFPRSPDRTRGFRLMFHIDGTLAPVSPQSRAVLERAVAARTGRHLEPRGNCQEYWVVGRTSLGELLLGARLAKSSRGVKARGAISYELAAVLVAASDPKPRDIFLDPFGGSGSLVLARLDFPLKQALYSDVRFAAHRTELDAKLMRDDRVRLLDEDALRLPSVPVGSVDVIVTDPPWGEFEAMDVPYDEFAKGLAASFARVLHPARGRYVVLVNRANALVLRRALSSAGLVPDAVHEILVNGHPATVLVRKRPLGSVNADQTVRKSGHVKGRTTARTAR